MSIEWLPFVLQTSDPLFPTGSYAHSLGLEEFARLSGATDETALLRFLELQIMPAIARQELPYLRYIHGAAWDLPAVVALDREINAWKIPAELRDASLRLGARRLAILLKASPHEPLPEFAGRIAAGDTLGHHLTVTALQYAQVPLDAALMTYLYQTLSSYCVAALKLLRIGQEGCQRALGACLAKSAECVRASLEITRDEAGCFNPLLEIASMRHQKAFERLFIS